MRIWTDSTLQPILDTDHYTGTDGTQYPNTPKGEIPGLHQVVEVSPPGDPLLYTWSIQLNDGVPTQTWTALPLATAKANIITNLEAKRNQVENAGIVVGDTAIGSDQTARTLLNDAITAMQCPGAPSEIRYKFPSGQWASVTLTMGQDMMAAIAGHVAACAANQMTMETAIMAATDIAGLQAIDINQGWPI